MEFMHRVQELVAANPAILSRDTIRRAYDELVTDSDIRLGRPIGASMELSSDANLRQKHRLLSKLDHAYRQYLLGTPADLILDPTETAHVSDYLDLLADYRYYCSHTPVDYLVRSCATVVWSPNLMQLITHLVQCQREFMENEPSIMVDYVLYVEACLCVTQYRYSEEHLSQVNEGAFGNSIDHLLAVALCYDDFCKGHHISRIWTPSVMKTLGKFANVLMLTYKPMITYSPRVLTPGTSGITTPKELEIIAENPAGPRS